MIHLSGGPKTALLLSVASAGVFAVMHALVRHVSETQHPFEIAFFRSLFSLAAILPLVVRFGPSMFKANRPGLLILRGVLNAASMLCWFFGLSLVPIAEATALSFSNILFASTGVAIFLGERMRLRRWSAVFVGFCGMLLILRPGAAALEVGSLLILVAAMMWGINTVILKQLSKTDGTLTIVAWAATFLTLATFFPALTVWKWPTLEELMWLALIGTLATIGSLAWTAALKMTEASLLIPTDFTRLVWAALIGFFFFAELPDGWTWAGSALIIASTAYIGFRENQLARQKRGAEGGQASE